MTNKKAKVKKKKEKGTVQAKVIKSNVTGGSSKPLKIDIKYKIKYKNQDKKKTRLDKYLADTPLMCGTIVREITSNQDKQMAFPMRHTPLCGHQV